MKRRAAFTPRASADVEAAFDWYEGQRNGLGGEFEAAVGQALDFLARMPPCGRMIFGHFDSFRANSAPRSA